jgi:Zn-finger nucleic acid-binding protein
MTFMDGRSYFVCNYCTAFHFQQSQDASPDRIQRIDEDGDLSCPVCRVRLVGASIEGSRVLYCEQCRGVLTSNDTFAAIARVRRATFTGEPDKPRHIDPSELQRVIHCPRCAGEMDGHPYYGPGNVVVDTCAACALIWLDHGEIAAIERAPGRR